MCAKIRLRVADGPLSSEPDWPRVFPRFFNKLVCGWQIALGYRLDAIVMFNLTQWS